MEETNKFSDYSQRVVMNTLKDADISIVTSANTKGKDDQFKSDDFAVYQTVLNDDYNSGISFK